MGSSNVLVFAVAGVMLLAGVMIVATGRRRAAAGQVRGETRRGETAASGEITSTVLAPATSAPDLDEEAR
ncbi:MAG: hypothetical protein ACRDZ1_00705, partial [Acidimicrobiia bacterium]